MEAFRKWLRSYKPGVMVLIPLVVGVTLRPASSRSHESSRKMKCSSGARQLRTGMAQYIDQFAKGRYYTWPSQNQASFNSAQWLISMYGASLLNDPGLFICPSERDVKGSDGRLVRGGLAGLTPSEVTYAGRNGIRGVVVDKMPTSTVMMSDDGEAGDNDDEGINVLLYDDDVHVDWESQVKPSDAGRNMVPEIRE